MKLISNWSVWKDLSENKDEQTIVSKTTTLNPDIEISSDEQGNTVEFNKKTRIETTFHKTEKDSKGNKLPIKKGKYDTNNNKILIWEEWDYEKKSHTKKYYVDDKLNGPCITTYQSGPLEKEIEIWKSGTIVQATKYYSNGEKEQKKFHNGDQKIFDTKLIDKLGKIKSEGRWSSGKRDGLWRWYENGKFISSMFYNMGVARGWGEDPQGNKIKGEVPKK